MPLSIRAALYPLLGKRVKGPLGDGISMIALVGTVFGVATSMGIGVVLLNVGFSLLFGLEQGLGLQIALVIVAVVLTIAATTSGVDKGIRWISALNLWSAAAMMLYILFTGQTAFLLNASVEIIGRFLVTLPERTLQTFAYEPDGAAWMGGWTLFFWAFWLAWGPFVGVFLARISRGRTLREFVIAAITAPVLCDFIIVSLFGNSALWEVLQGNDAFAALAVESPEQGWYVPPHGARRARAVRAAAALDGAGGRQGAGAVVGAAARADARLPVPAAGRAVPRPGRTPRDRRCGRRVPGAGLSGREELDGECDDRHRRAAAAGVESTRP